LPLLTVCYNSFVKLKRRFGFSIRPKAPYNFGLTVHKPAGWALFTPFESYEEGILRTAFHLNGTLLGLKIRNRGTTGEPAIFVEVFMTGVPTPDQKKTIRETLSAKLGADQDLEAFYRMARKDSILKHAVRDLYGMHDTDTASIFAEATLAILLQMAPLNRSERMWECVIRNYGEIADFDSRKVRVWPTPERIAAAGPAELEQKCKLGYRAKHLVGTAAILGKGDFPRFGELKKMSPAESRRRLLELPGIGDYSADIIGPYPGFPIDAWSADVFATLFWGRKPGRGRDMIDKVKKAGIKRWGGHRWMAFLYVAHDLEGLSRKLGLNLRLS
jgi:3-methyladenine DNA glycosylase/8-oxoguanine DNA glycosylase